MNSKKNIRTLSFEELKAYFATINEKKFRAKQLWEWLWMLGQQIHLQIQIRAPFLKLGQPVLLDQDHCSRQQRTQTQYSLQPEKRSGIKFRHAVSVCHDVSEYPQCNKEQNQDEIKRAPGKSADVFKDPLRATDLFLFARVERQNGLNILADLIHARIGGFAVGI